MSAPKLNPYTQAIKNCLDGLEHSKGIPTLDKSTAQFLANMIQGRFVQYLISRVSLDLNIGRTMDKELSMVLMKLLTDKFFTVFREKVKLNPQIVAQVAIRITETEQESTDTIEIQDQLYQYICENFFDYIYFDYLIRWLETSAEVERIAFVARVDQTIENPKIQRAIRHILREDKTGIIPMLFNRYLNKERVDRLIGLVKSGDWRIEAQFIESQTTPTISWREFMSRLN